MSYEISKSDAIDWAHIIRLLVDSLVAEGFTEYDAQELVFTMVGGKK